uniref:Uncharacterized protein n=1 Tax=Castor canadensis TaxID=51338 RepID=A0A8C0ZME0_CASCN
MEGQSSGGSRRPGTRAGLGPSPGTHTVRHLEPRRLSRMQSQRTEFGHRDLPPVPLFPGSLWLHGMWGLPCPLTMSHPSSTLEVAITVTMQT